jgi:hypothetical protein
LAAVTEVEGAVLEVEGVVLVVVVVAEEVTVAGDADGVSSRDSRQKRRSFETVICIRELREE